MRRFCLKLISLIGIIILIAGCIPLSTAEENRTEFNPVRVSTLEAYARGKYSLYWDFMAQDNRGNLYADMLYSSMAPSDGNTYDLYDIDGKYLYFRGVVGAKYNNNGINDKYTAIIRIYGDDRLLFSDENITSTSKAYEIELDIRDVMDLKIEMYGSTGTGKVNPLLCTPRLLP